MNWSTFTKSGKISAIPAMQMVTIIIPVKYFASSKPSAILIVANGLTEAKIRPA